MIHIVKECYPRCWALRIDAPSYVLDKFSTSSQESSVLERLALHSSNHGGSFDGEVQLGTARPTQVSISELDVDCVRILWDRVTKVELEYINYDDLLKVLQAAPGIEDGTFTNVGLPAEAFDGPDNPIVGASMQRFVFTTVGPEDPLADQLLEHITLPAIKDFTFCDEGNFLSAGNFIPFLQRSRCSLTRLVLCCMYFEDCQDLISILKEIPSLKDFNLQPYDDGLLTPILRHLGHTSLVPATSQEAFLPRLEIFYYKMVSDFFGWGGFPEIFGHISDIDSPQRRPLRCLEVEIDPSQLSLTTDYCIPPPILQHFLQLKAAGIELRLPAPRTNEDLLQVSVDLYDVDFPPLNT